MKRILCIVFTMLYASIVSADSAEHIVNKGDTLYSIALEYGVNLAALMEWNGIDDPSKLSVGTRLRIPSTYVAVKRDTLWGIAHAHGTTVPELRELNGFPDDYELLVGDVVLVPGTVESRFATPEGSTESDSTDETTPAEPAEVAASTTDSDSEVSATASSVSLADDLRWPHGGTREDRKGKFPGTEFVGQAGDPVYAVSSGIVVWKATTRVFGGYLVIVQNDDGYQFVYGGTDAAEVETYQRVQAGTQIGRLGTDPNTGESRLFFTVMKDGKIVDPEGAPRG